MKYLSILFLLTLLVSCKEDKEITTSLPPANENTAATSTDQHADSNTVTSATKSNAIVASGSVTDFLKDIKSFARSEKGNSIENFQKLADDTAAEKIDISKENFGEALKKATDFKYIFITVENHTVVKIDDVSKCKPSGSWATCVPYAQGYIKKGDMIYQEDYANNIIGLPNDQKRTMYLFN
ncbi:MULTISPECIES: hypothetical protein [Nonlabens]|uniref:Lipoprotein n=1 Tax=Nonlabens xylanidelens TaxID=191564 RepID=A0A2S6IJS5_9FLAO|nr:hypothetical protein [Nonlabens xylanidelens]PPK94482.1 hypothetical protein LY01_02122 [Nonlabens xylanidelens]PQJ21360.1 hypothetical protein BST94_03985 [Nonlabens xylanidelens]